MSEKYTYKGVTSLTDPTTTEYIPSQQDPQNSLYGITQTVPETASLIVIGSIILCLVIIARNLACDNTAQRYQGILHHNGKLYFAIIASITFTLGRAFIDLYMSISTDNAMNFILAMFGLAIGILPFTEKYRSRFIHMAGWWLLGRGLLNVAILLYMLGATKTAQLVIGMPISALPNMAISYLLPLGFGVYLLRLHFFKRDKIHPPICSEL